MNITQLEYINRLIPFFYKPVIKIITGMRRFGKSTSSNKKYIFIDEVQKIKEWERTVNSILSK